MEHPFHSAGYQPPFDSPLHRLDGRTKLICMLAGVIVAVSTPPTALMQMAAYGTMLAAGLAIGRVPLGYTLRRWLIIVPFICAAVFLPMLGPKDFSLLGLSLSRAGLIVFSGVAIKATLAMMALTILTGSTHLGDMLSGLRKLKAPLSLVATAAMTWRYTFILADEARRMHRAATLRGYGARWVWHAGTLGNMVGALFLRGYERSERVHAAMLCRGFDGRNVVAEHSMHMRACDWATLAIWCSLLAALRLSSI